MILLILLLICSNCYAGMDFTSLRGKDQAMIYKIPHFHSLQEGIDFGNKAKWNEDLMIQLKLRLNEFSEILKEIDSYRNPKEDSLEWDIYYKQWRGMNQALQVMEEYKKKGEKGDPAQVGSTFYAGSIPL